VDGGFDMGGNGVGDFDGDARLGVYNEKGN